MTPRRLLATASLVACAALAATTIPGPPDEPDRQTPRVVLSAGTPSPTAPVDVPEPAPQAAPPRQPGPREVGIVMGGDLLWHNTVWQSAAADAATTGHGHFDFDPMFADLKPVIEGADLAICHGRCRSPSRGRRCRASPSSPRHPRSLPGSRAWASTRAPRRPTTPSTRASTV